MWIYREQNRGAISVYCRSDKAFWLPAKIRPSPKKETVVHSLLYFVQYWVLFITITKSYLLYPHLGKNDLHLFPLCFSPPPCPQPPGTHHTSQETKGPVSLHSQAPCMHSQLWDIRTSSWISPRWQHQTWSVVKNRLWGRQYWTPWTGKYVFPKGQQLQYL